MQCVPCFLGIFVKAREIVSFNIYSGQQMDKPVYCRCQASAAIHRPREMKQLKSHWTHAWPSTSLLPMMPTVTNRNKRSDVPIRQPGCSLRCFSYRGCAKDKGQPPSACDRIHEGCCLAAQRRADVMKGTEGTDRLAKQLRVHYVIGLIRSISSV